MTKRLTLLALTLLPTPPTILFIMPTLKKNYLIMQYSYVRFQNRTEIFSKTADYVNLCVFEHHAYGPVHTVQMFKPVLLFY